MRQSGILAAAGLYALDEGGLERMADDHARAKRLSEALAGLKVWTAQIPETNILLFEPTAQDQPAEDLCAKLRETGILCHPNRYHQVRLVMHLGVDDEAVEEIVRRASEVLA